MYGTCNVSYVMEGVRVDFYNNKDLIKLLYKPNYNKHIVDVYYKDKKIVLPVDMQKEVNTDVMYVVNKMPNNLTDRTMKDISLKILNHLRELKAL